MLIAVQVYEMTNDEAYRAVKWALDAGYRHIDTAEWHVPSFLSLILFEFEPCCSV